MSEDRFTVAVAVDDRAVVLKNLGISPGIRGGKHQLVIREKFLSASTAYNSALDAAEHDVVILIHQDVYLPDAWFTDLMQSLDVLERDRLPWGVLGCFGSTKERWGGVGLVCDTGAGLCGNEIDRPEPVETLDESVLVVRRSSGLRFDAELPHFHLYGTDLCMAARARGMTSYAIPAFCIHNTNQLLALPSEFYDCYRFVKKKWARFLPIHTSCLDITRFDGALRLRRFREGAKKILGIDRLPLLREEDPRVLLGANCRQGRAKSRWPQA